jgi:hypothetical protein
MRNIVIAAAGLAAALLPVTAASAQYHGGYRHDRVRAEQRECQRELRHARNRWEYRRELAECRREIARARYRDGYRYDRYRHRGY